MASNFGKIQAWGWADGEDSWGLDVNNNFATVDRLLKNPVNGIVSDPTTITSPANNDLYIVGASATGAFVGQEGRLSYWSDVAYGGDDTWKFLTSPVGMSMDMADGTSRTHSEVAGVKYWIQTNSITVHTWAEFKNAMQSASYTTVDIGTEVFASANDLFTLPIIKRVTGLPVNIEGNTLTLNTSSVDFFCEVNIGTALGVAGVLTGDSALIRFRRLTAFTSSSFTGTGAAQYERISGAVAGTTKIYWDSTGGQVDSDTTISESTGVKTGGVLSIGAGASEFSITDGTGQIVDGVGAIVGVTWSGITNITPTNIATTARTYLAIDSAGLLVQSSTDFSVSQSRTLIILGIAVHFDNVNVVAVNNQQHIAYNAMSSLYDLAEAIGIFNINGNLFSGNGVNLSLDKSVGNVFRGGVNYATDSNNPHEKTLPLLTALTFTYAFNNDATGATGTLIDPTTLDDGAGGTTPLSNNTKWSVQRIYSFSSNIVGVQRGVSEFNSLDDAINGISGEPYFTAPSIKPNALLRGLLIVKKNATDLTDIAQAQFIDAPKFGEGGGSAGGSATLVDLQTAYNNSVSPEIVTDATRGAVTLKRGSALDADNVLEIQNGAGTTNASITGDGDATFGGVLNSNLGQVNIGAYITNWRQMVGGLFGFGVESSDANSSDQSRIGMGEKLLISSALNAPVLNGSNYSYALNFGFNSTEIDKNPNDVNMSKTQLVMPYSTVNDGSVGDMAYRAKFNANDFGEYRYLVASDVDGNYPMSRGRILQGNVTDDNVSGIQGASLGIPGLADFGSRIKVDTTFGTPLVMRSTGSNFMSSEGDGNIGWTGDTLTGLARFFFNSQTGAANTFGLFLYSLDGATSQEMFKATYDSNFEIFRDLEVPKILQGVTTDSGEGIQGTSLGIDGDATFGGIVNASRGYFQDSNNNNFPIRAIEAPNAVSTNIFMQGDGELGILGVRANSSRRFNFRSETTTDSNFLLRLYDSAGLNSKVMFSTDYATNTFETVATFKATDNILQGGTTDTGEGIQGASIKSDGDSKAASFTLSALNTAPTSATDTGVIGEIRWDASYMYVCTATNTWKRSAIATW